MQMVTTNVGCGFVVASAAGDDNDDDADAGATRKYVGQMRKCFLQFEAPTTGSQRDVAFN